MINKKAMVHFSTCERNLHHDGQSDFVVARLPFVVVIRGEYPHSFEANIREALDGSMKLDVTVDPAHGLPFPIERITEIALDYYRRLLPMEHSTLPADASGRPRISSRTYEVELE